MSEIYKIKVKDISGKEFSLEKYQGKLLLIVNTASKCGFTPQYKDLERLYQAYQKQGLMVLGFPCNQFGNQEPGDEGQIQEFCEINFGVSFPLFSKVDVNGKDAHPLFQYLKKSLPGFLGSEFIKWNFTKFLVDREGHPIKRYGPKDSLKDLEKKIMTIVDFEDL